MLLFFFLSGHEFFFYAFFFFFLTYKLFLVLSRKTKEAIDEKGWLHTGDIGRINPNGTISIIDRRKNMFKVKQNFTSTNTFFYFFKKKKSQTLQCYVFSLQTAHGEYIAAEKIESIYSRAATVSQFFVYGNQYKSFVIAVVVPNAQVIEDILKKSVLGKKSGEWTKNVRFGTDEFSEYFVEICEKHLDKIKDIIFKDIKNEEKELKPFEHVKDIIIEYHIDHLSQGFNVENGCLTPTSKLKRPQITRKLRQNLKQLLICKKIKIIAFNRNTKNTGFEKMYKNCFPLFVFGKTHYHSSDDIFILTVFTHQSKIEKQTVAPRTPFQKLPIIDKPQFWAPPCHLHFTDVFFDFVLLPAELVTEEPVSFGRSKLKQFDTSHNRIV
ncbi:long-chain-fatty-acid--CoA ligase 5 [Reticulomyxa filosa]|uniref:Long-chain-fatty-acid--CoA ligase 5 n=1 Tax=Reticulomyxa filosa TaxID=46433 RepID=X6P4Y8_RETFI|nr:long-chain-fatty-acid--CoA ligase 5 [Reticulomyxa filosa]|eukprot:ETO33610.1 long-chain-fatty-acid--CoA ligase 5 [Reticulomyxa filosa]